VSPKLKSLLARLILVGGVALLGSYIARSAPHDQSIAIRLGSRDVQRLDGVVTREGDDEPTAGFSQVFPAGATRPRVVRHAFSAVSGTYIVVISLKESIAGDAGPNLIETSFERRVSLVGGEVIVSPD
jgi:hypothetical protein